MHDLFEKSPGTSSLLSENICEAEQQENKELKKGRNLHCCNATIIKETETRHKATHLQRQMEVAPVKKREGNTELPDGNEGGIIKKVRRIFC